jgi:predicted AlkP superfamily phosphohydrolase/phosphomutase
MVKPRYRVLVLGLDGATFDLMLPWMEQGHLPWLAKLATTGARSPLVSTIPPITPCAWSSFMTGKNPGKHGLFDFVEPMADGRGFRFTNASCRRGQTLWGYLSRQGRRVGVMNVPMTYPPESVNGYLLSGLDTPNEDSPFSHPAVLREELRAQALPYRIDVQHLGNMRTDSRRDRRLEELRDVETMRTRTLLYLQRRYPADFTMLVYTATDQVQHHFWHYMDPRHDKYDVRGAERYRNAIRDVYVHIDGLIGSVLDEIDDETIVIVMSDHGFGPTTNLRIRLNQVLARQGLLTFSSENKSSRTFRRLAGALDGVLRATLSNGAKRFLASRLPRLRVWFEKLDEAPIDTVRSRAYVNEAFRASPAIWLSDKDDALLEQVEAVLKNLKDPKTGQPAISHVYRTCDLYQGQLAAQAPDLIPSWWEDGFLIEQSRPASPRETDVERSTRPITGGVEFAGSHRLEGVFMIAGGPVRRGHVFSGARIIDVAPTVLYLMGLPIPSDMDGTPITEALEPQFVAENPLRQAGTDGTSAEPTASVFSDDEAKLIEERLKSLGYIE